MNRRKFISKSLLSLSGITIGGGLLWLNLGKGTASMNIKNTISFLNEIDQKLISSSGKWSIDKIFFHLAQSIEYSILGYPEHKSNAFKNSVGALAFKAFSTRGEMTHPLDEEIPGAPIWNNKNSQTLARLITALKDFENFNGPLKPHFAYGHLNKEQYTWAHIMHIENHFKEINLS